MGKNILSCFSRVRFVFCNVISAENVTRGILHIHITLLRGPCARIRRQTEAKTLFCVIIFRDWDRFV